MNDSDKFYDEVYLRRVNRFGTNTTERIQGQREFEFEDLLNKSVYRIDFWQDGVLVPGILTKKSQDDSETIQYLLVRRDCELTNGTILEIGYKDQTPLTWMVYYKEQLQASGYNRYIVLKITNIISWIAKDNKTSYTTKGYFHGNSDAALRDTLKSHKDQPVFNQNENNLFLVCPTHSHLNKDDYFEVTTSGITESFKVVGRDIQSTPGVMFVTIDPVYKYDLTAAPTRPAGDTSDDYYWLEGGGS